MKPGLPLVSSSPVCTLLELGERPTGSTSLTRRGPIFQLSNMKLQVLNFVLATRQIITVVLGSATVLRQWDLQ